MTSAPDDALATHELDLVTRASKGDAAAFDRFYERNAPGVQLLIERLLGPGNVADTVLVESFEKTVRRLPLLGARNSSPRLYALTTARNGAYAALGRDRSEPPNAAVKALLSLPSRQRELLALRELGLSEAECAEVAGIEPPEVGIQVARARLRLTDALEGATLSAVFAEPRAERLLAAEVVRQGGGGSLAPELDDEITQLADSDARFAAALSAVRSPSRSVGQLPPASGPSRLAPVTRDRAVIAATGVGAAGASAAAASSAQAAPPKPAPPKPAPRDPYDDEIGDEAAWGIVDDDELVDDPRPSPPALPADGPEPQGSPNSEPWDSGTPPAPEPAAAPRPDTGDAPPHSEDPLAAWDDALDWDDDDHTWTAGGAPTGDTPTRPAPAASGPMAGAPIDAEPGESVGRGPVPTDPDATRAFDVVAAGLADPDDEAAVTRIAPGAPAGFDFGGGDADVDDDYLEDERRSPWRFLLWIIGFALLFAGVAFAAYTYQQAKDSPSAPPSSTIEPTDAAATSPDEAKRTTGSSSSTKRSPSPKPSASPKTSSSSSSSGSSSGSSGSSGSSSGSSGSSGSSNSGTSGGSSSSSGNSGGATTGGNSGSSSGDTDRTVSGGESTSGGSVRGESSTTP
ncbi:MAG: hypothetical protein J7513_04965 [Solirubrobacteraceae bacterium]|nr:hypothetical protein [Solirubrobacteraceae bacterium]